LKLKASHTASRPTYQPASVPLTEGHVISGGVAPPPSGPKPRVEVQRILCEELLRGVPPAEKIRYAYMVLM
jgi:hypothetical protein